MVSLIDRFNADDYPFQCKIYYIPDKSLRAAAKSFSCTSDQNDTSWRESIVKERIRSIFEFIKTTEYHMFDDGRGMLSLYLKHEDDAIALKAAFKTEEPHRSTFHEGEPGEDFRKIKRVANGAYSFIRGTEFRGRIQFSIDRAARAVIATANNGNDMIRFIAYMRDLDKNNPAPELS